VLADEIYSPCSIPQKQGLLYLLCAHKKGENIVSFAIFHENCTWGAGQQFGLVPVQPREGSVELCISTLIGLACRDQNKQLDSFSQKLTLRKVLVRGKTNILSCSP